MPRLLDLRRFVLVFIVALCGFPSSTQANFNFAGPIVPYDTQYDPISVTSGDFDGNGTVDFATANQSSHSVTIFLGQGQGLLNLGVHYPVGQYPRCVQTGDLNQDGHLDLAIACESGKSVTLLWGAGDGTFPNRTDLSLNDYPMALAVGDLDGSDSYPDLAVSVSSGEILIFRNSGGSFGAPSSLTVDATPGAISISDMNLDGHNDLVVSGIGVTVFLGIGNASFNPPITTAVGLYTNALITAFINHDSYPDVCVAADTAVVVLLGDGDGTFTSTPALVAIYASSFAAGDFDNDGNMDIAMVDGDVNVVKGNGDGTFGQPKRFFVGPGWSIVSTDLDGDTRLDLVASVYSIWGALATLRGYGDGNFGLDRTVDMGTRPGAPAAEDLNQDGKPDLVVPDQDGGGLVLRYGEVGGFGPKITFPGPTGGSLIEFGDINGDGIKDAVVSTGIAIAVYLGSGNGVFGAPTSYPTAPLVQSLAVGDLNQDGYDDVASATGDKGSIWLGHSNGALSWLQDYDEARTPVALGDFNEDGQLDLASMGWAYEVRLFPGNGDGTFDQTVASYFISVAGVMKIADVNGDNHLDLAWGGPAGDVGVVLGDGQGTFVDTQPEFVSSYVDGRVEDVDVGDFDLDGKPDVAVMNSQRSVVTLFQGVGDGTLARAMDLGIGRGNVWGMVSADFDQDGDSDLAVSTSNWIDYGGANGVTLLYNLVGAQVGVQSPLVSSLPPLRLLTNPARGRMSVQVNLAKSEHVRLEVLDLSGRRVAVPMDGMLPAGEHTVAWRGESISGRPATPGVYVIRMVAEGKSRAVKAIWLRD